MNYHQSLSANHGMHVVVWLQREFPAEKLDQCFKADEMKRRYYYKLLNDTMLVKGILWLFALLLLVCAAGSAPVAAGDFAPKLIGKYS